MNKFAMPVMHVALFDTAITAAADTSSGTIQPEQQAFTAANTFLVQEKKIDVKRLFEFEY